MPSKQIQLALKRIIDILVSTLGLLLLSPLGVLCAIAIKLDSPGPILFFQDRLGLHGKVFQILKFRTMVVGAPDGAVETGSQDPRVTTVGAVLRKWSLDETPQLLNVLRNDMSLVGPRPDRIFRLPEYTDYQKQRLAMRPGITGLAQVSGRNALTWQRRRALDVAYVENWSLWLDIKIIFRTVGVVFGRQGVDYEGMPHDLEIN
jgi:lipopolysaccharide/colanic/teichoic acid biosynthesis glycosyltransferase